MITLTKNDENDEIIKVAQLSVEDALKELNTSQSGSCFALEEIFS